MFRCYAHIYHAHFSEFEKAKTDKNLNGLCKHLVIFCKVKTGSDCKGKFCLFSAHLSSNRALAREDWLSVVPDWRPMLADHIDAIIVLGALPNFDENPGNSCRNCSICFRNTCFSLHKDYAYAHACAPAGEVRARGGIGLLSDRGWTQALFLRYAAPPVLP